MRKDAKKLKYTSGKYTVDSYSVLLQAKPMSPHCVSHPNYTSLKKVLNYFQLPSPSCTFRGVEMSRIMTGSHITGFTGHARITHTSGCW